MPVWIAQPVNRSRIPMEELRIQHLARPAILLQASLPDLAQHLGFHCTHRFIHSRSCDIFNHLIACDRQIYADRLGNSEHEPIVHLPVADLFVVLLPACVRACRQPFKDKTLSRTKCRRMIFGICCASWKWHWTASLTIWRRSVSASASVVIP